MKAAAITGIGIISCLGTNTEDVTSSLRNGKSGIILDPEREERGFKSGLTSAINGFTPKDWGFNRKTLRTMCEPAIYSCAAASDAVKDSGLDDNIIKSDRCGIIFGNDSTIKAAVESIDITRKHKETHYIGAGYIFKTMNSTVTMNLAAHFGTKGANWTISAACASGAHVIGQALMLIRSGMQDVVITGGAQELNWMGMASFDSLKAFSTRFDSPGEASRPFDINRDGLVPGGGAASLIIEDLEHAIKRNANIYCIIEGYGFSSGVGKNLSEPNSKGSAVAMVNALKDADVAPSQIDYINAHATSTPVGDIAEAKAINEVFGDKTKVSSTKSMTGHECWMSGSSEVLYSILMAKNNFIAPNINFEKLSDSCPKINVVKETEQMVIKRSVSNSFGFGGTNAALVLKYL